MARVANTVSPDLATMGQRSYRRGLCFSRWRCCSGHPAHVRRHAFERLPGGATPGITLTVLGTGFNLTAANDLVTFTPVAGAPSRRAAKTVATVDAATGLRRITVVVPDGLPVGPWR